MLFLQVKWDFETKKCYMIKWYNYLHGKYKKHIKQKQNNVFFPQSGKNNMNFFCDKPQQSFVCHTIQYTYENTG